MTDLTVEHLARRRDDRRHEYDLRLSALHGAAAWVVDRGSSLDQLRRYVEAADAAQRAWSEASQAYARFVRGERELFDAALVERVQ